MEIIKFDVIHLNPFAMIKYLLIDDEPKNIRILKQMLEEFWSYFSMSSYRAKTPLTFWTGCCLQSPLNTKPSLPANSPHAVWNSLQGGSPS